MRAAMSKARRPAEFLDVMLANADLRVRESVIEGARALLADPLEGEPEVMGACERLVGWAADPEDELSESAVRDLELRILERVGLSYPGELAKMRQAIRDSWAGLVFLTHVERPN
jgi:hypothetical protein